MSWHFISVIIDVYPEVKLGIPDIISPFDAACMGLVVIILLQNKEF